MINLTKILVTVTIIAVGLSSSGIASPISESLLSDKESASPPNSVTPELLKPEDFERWLHNQGEQTVQKIMAKIGTPEDTTTQHAAKIAVARYLVNVTFTAMSKRLLKYGRDLPESAYKSENILVPAFTTQIGTSNIPTNLINKPAAPLNDNHVAPVNNQAHHNANNLHISELFVHHPSTPFQIPFPAAVPSELIMPAVEAGLMPVFIYKGDDNETYIAGIPESSLNQTGDLVTGNRPIWQEILNFNLSNFGNGGARLPFNFSLPALRPEGGNSSFRLPTLNFSLPSGGGARLPFNLSALGGEGGNRLPFNLSFPTAGGQGGPRLPFNFSLPTAGQGGGPRLPFNFSFPTSGGQGGGPRLPFNFSLPTAGEGGARLPFNFSLPSGGGQGGPRLPFNFSLPSSEGGVRLPFNLTSLGGAEGGARLPFNFSLPAGGIAIGFLNINGGNSNPENTLNGNEAEGFPFNFSPPEGLFSIPTLPPHTPINDSYTASQMYLGNQVDNLVSEINNQNLSGVVGSTLNIATPSTVGVLVNSLLNIVFCHPLDRWNGNCQT